MTRQWYETEADRQNESRLADLVQQRYNCVLTKLAARKYQIDYIAQRDGKAVAFFEMRQRKNAMNAYGDYMIALHKSIISQSLTDTTGLPCYLVVGWTDVVGMCKLPPDNSYIAIGGSVRRNDPQDIEPMTYIPLTEFKLIGKTNET